MRTIIVTLTAAAATVALFALPATASAVNRPPLLMQNNDQAAVFAQTSVRGPLAAVRWTACGLPTLELPCQPGQIPTFTDWTYFRRWADAGGTGTVLIDYEGHSSPPWLMNNLPYFIKQTARLATSRGIHAIFAPVPSAAAAAMTRIATKGTAAFLASSAVLTEMISVDALAARYGAYAVDIQEQWMTRYPPLFRTFTGQAAAAIRAANPHTAVLAGIATNPSGNPVTLAEMVASYRAVRWAYRVGFWVNAADWGPPGYGYPLTGAEFLAYVYSHP